MSADAVDQVDESSGPDEATLGEATRLGWVPKEQFKGDPGKWIEADKFLERGKELLPFLRKNNESLSRSQQEMYAELQKLRGELAATKQDMGTMQELHNEQLRERVAQARSDLLAQLKVAKREGDTDLEVDLTDKLTQLTDAGKELDKKESEGKQEETQLPPNPSFQAWQAKNSAWFGIDPAKTNQAVAVGHWVKSENPNLLGEAFYAEVDKRMAQMQAGATGEDTSPRQPGKAAASRGTTGRSDAGRTYADLPSEAKSQCDRYAKKFVNPNGQFKTEGDYRKHYITQLEQTGYFEDLR